MYLSCLILFATETLKPTKRDYVYVSESPTQMTIKVYGADWCSMTKRTLAHLDQKHVAYDYIDIDADREGAKWVAEQNGGKERKPTLDIDGLILSEPTNEEVDEALAGRK